MNHNRSRWTTYYVVLAILFVCGSIYFLVSGHTAISAVVAVGAVTYTVCAIQAIRKSRRT